MQPSGIIGESEIMQPNWIVPHQVPLLARFFGKFVVDILPAALASVIGGFLFTQYQFGHAPAPRLATEQVTPASAEMMALVRDEHTMIIDYLKSQIAAEKSRLVAEDSDSARAAAEAEAANASEAADPKIAADAATRRVAAALVAPKTVSPRAKAPVAVTAVVAAPHAPLVIAQADQNDGVANQGAAPPDRLARDPNSLLAKTLDVKDHVVAATRSVVFAIGDIFASVGDVIGGAPSARQFNSDY
jgi:hypothetical protein